MLLLLPVVGLIQCVKRSSPSDVITEQGMRAYAKPIGSDPAVVSGESGAVTCGLLRAVLESDSLRERFQIDHDSVILLINTEGDTDPASYRRIVS